MEKDLKSPADTKQPRHSDDRRANSETMKGGVQEESKEGQQAAEIVFGTDSAATIAVW